MRQSSINFFARPTVFLSILCLTGVLSLSSVKADIVPMQAKELPSNTTRSASMPLSNTKTPEGVNPSEWLLQQMRMAQARYDDFFLKQSIDKLIQIIPDNPEVLQAQIYLSVRENNLERARLQLDHLKVVAPRSDMYEKAKLLIALTEPNLREKLQEARLSAAAGHLDQAKKEYDALFNGLLPTLDLSVEYLRLLNRMPEYSGGVLQKLSDLDSRYPGNPNLRTALVRLLFEQNKVTEAYGLLEKMADQTSTRNEAAKLWQEYLKTLTVTPDSLAQWQRFAAIYTEENLTIESKKEIDRQQGLLADPAYQARLEGLALIEKGQSDAAIADLNKALAKTPDDPELVGALGLAYLRMNKREQALALFKRAKILDKIGRSGDKWDALITSTNYWMLLNDAEIKLKAGQFSQAKVIYEQAHKANDQEISALIGLGDVAFARKQNGVAEKYYLQALKLDPNSDSPVRALANLYESISPQKALYFLNNLTKSQKVAMKDKIRELQSGILSTEADQLIEKRQAVEAILKLRQAIKYAPDDIWLRYKLAKVYESQGQNSQGDLLFESIATQQAKNLQFIYAYALYLNNSDREQRALEVLETLPEKLWDEDIQELVQQIHQQQIIAHANQLRDAGNEQAAIAYLNEKPKNIDNTMLIADWALARLDYETALREYQSILQQDAASQDAQLGEIEALLGLKRLNAAREQLSKFKPSEDISLSQSRRNANAWFEAGDLMQAQTLFDHLKSKIDRSQASDDHALIFRDAARIERQTLQVDKALYDYKQAMLMSGIMPMPNVVNNQSVSDTTLVAEGTAEKTDSPDISVSDETFTRSTRIHANDDWLKRSIRSDAAELYAQQMPTLTIDHDYWGSSGTPGISNLKAHTTMVQLEMPWRDGRAFFRTDYIRMNAGRFQLQTETIDQTLPNQDVTIQKIRQFYSESFGTCALGCTNNIRQAQQGASVAVGWENDRWHFDIGTTPLGFEVKDWVGSIAYSNNWKKISWTLTASRRPISSSLLSFSGAKDPGTGIRWGGARATGLSLSLSYDEGGKHGVWADLSAHKITGQHIQDNERARFMAGYYYKIINDDHRRLSVGLNTMLWHYKYDASGYTLGQGGYYSPQRYVSFSLPISYRQRTDNWAFELNTSISWSRSKIKSSDKYPLNLNWPADAAGYCAQFSQCDITESDYTRFLNNRTNVSSRGGGFGYTVRALAERRLDSNWRLGAGIDIQKAKDYTPSHAFIYLRYSFAPWQGDLDLPSKPLEPYSEFK